MVTPDALFTLFGMSTSFLFIFYLTSFQTLFLCFVFVDHLFLAHSVTFFSCCGFIYVYLRNTAEEAHETMKWCVWWFLVFTCISQVFMAMSTGWRSCSTRKIRRSFKWRSRIKPNLVMEQKLAVELYWQTTHFVFSFWYNRSYDSPGQAETANSCGLCPLSTRAFRCRKKANRMPVWPRTLSTRPYIASKSPAAKIIRISTLLRPLFTCRIFRKAIDKRCVRYKTI